MIHQMQDRPWQSY
ncbi:hypothetical protein Taro_034591, partial [Colocasia esculenta]|nr:hypothetical protein [Colocasia esculenta]